MRLAFSKGLNLRVHSWSTASADRAGKHYNLKRPNASTARDERRRHVVMCKIQQETWEACIHKGLTNDIGRSIRSASNISWRSDLSITPPLAQFYGLPWVIKPCSTWCHNLFHLSECCRCIHQVLSLSQLVLPHSCPCDRSRCTQGRMHGSMNFDQHHIYHLCEMGVAAGGMRW